MPRGATLRLAGPGQGSLSATVAVALGLLVAGCAAAGAVVLGPMALALPLLLAVAVALVAHPPVLLAVFLFVPFFKSLSLLENAPVDPTLATGMLLVLACLLRVTRGGVQMPPAGFLVPFALLAGWFALSLLIGTPVDYGIVKVEKLVTVTTLAALAPFVILRRRSDVVQFLLAIACGAIAVAAATPFVRPTVAAGIVTEFDTKGRYSFGGQIYPARFLSMGAIVLALAPLWSAHRWRAAGPLLALGVMVIALGFGARGPIVALALTGVTTVLLLIVSSPRALAAIVAAAIVGGLVLSVIPLQGTAAVRLDGVARNPIGTLQADPRLRLYDAALDLVDDRPLLGLGSGAFAPYGRALSPINQELLYPHNVFLEIAVEGGIPLAALVACSFVLALTMLLRRFTVVGERRDRGVVTVVMALLLFSLLAAQLSGDINDNRILWSLLALGWGIARDGPPRA